MCRIILIACLSVSFLVTLSYSARILVVVSTPSYSHQIVFQPIWRELSLRGHQVVALTTDPIKDERLVNLTEIDWSYSYTIWKQWNLIEFGDKTLYQMFEDSIPIFEEITNYQLSHPEVQKLIKDENQHFDLLLVESIFPISLAFAERFKCPYIIISSLDVPNYVQELVGNPVNPILYPDFMTPYVGEMNFYGRVTSVYYSLFLKYYTQLRFYPLSDMLIEKHFGHSYPPLFDISKNVSMIFVNTEPIFHIIRPLVPAVIPIGGGMHLKKSNPLPRELQDRLDNAREGFIYFSLGTNAKTEELPENTPQIFLETFSELPYKVLWKSEIDLKEVPDNVLISKWFPQQDVFRHPNIKLFITQGGLQSTEEAVYNKIPLVVIPLFGDQPINAQLMVNKGIAVELDYRTLDKVTFKNAILEVLNNPKYRKNVEQLSHLVKDQPTTGLERAVWWTEYVLRHKGAQHLRGPAVDVPLYQQFLLDIVGIVFAILIIGLLLTITLIKSAIKVTKYIIFSQKKKVD